MQHPEYLELFSPRSGAGTISVEVKFKDHDGRISDLKMSAREIEKIINPDDGEFYREMRFDDWLFDIYKYQIDPIKKKMTIMARKKHD